MKKNVFEIKKIVALGLIAVMAFCMAACGQITPAKQSKPNKTEESVKNETKVIRVASQPATAFRAEIADAKGFWEDEFAKDGIKVENIDISNGPAFVEAVSSNQVDLGIFGDQPLIAGNASGKKVEIIARFSHDAQNFKLVATKESGIKTAKDLKGKKVSVSAGQTTQKMLIKILKAEGIDESEIEQVFLEGADAVTSLQSGEIDAALFFGTPGVNAVANGGVEITDLRPYANDVQIIAASTEFVENNPELAARYLKVIARTAKWINDNNEEAIEIAKRERNLNDDQARQLLASEDREIGYTDEDDEALNETAQFIYDSGLVNKLLTTKDFVDTQYLKLAGFLD